MVVAALGLLTPSPSPVPAEKAGLVDPPRGSGSGSSFASKMPLPTTGVLSPALGSAVLSTPARSARPARPARPASTSLMANLSRQNRVERSNSTSEIPSPTTSKMPLHTAVPSPGPAGSAILSTPTRPPSTSLAGSSRQGLEPKKRLPTAVPSPATGSAVSSKPSRPAAKCVVVQTVYKWQDKFYAAIPGIIPQQVRS